MITLNYLPILLLIIILVGVGTLSYRIFPNAGAGTWPGHSGQNIINVPIEWCALIGSPAAPYPPAIPQVPISPFYSFPADYDTDAILMKRLERATEYYITGAGISFRSAMDNTTSGAPHFPIFPIPLTHHRGADVLWPNYDRTQFENIMNKCINAWSTLHLAGTGIPVVNINLFHDAQGHPADWIGFGIYTCTADIRTLTCLYPNEYRGKVMIDDNHYFFPGIPDRNVPGTDRTYFFDPFDRTLGHELGHALGLRYNWDSLDRDGHSTTNPKELMFAGGGLRISNLTPNGWIDNVFINDEEATRLRVFANFVPGHQADPAGRILNGDILETDKVAGFRQNNSKVPAFLDLSQMRVIVNKTGNKASFGQELFGLIPNKTKILEYWTLVDTDNNTKTGAGQKLLQSIGAPLTKFTGADLIIKAEVNGTGVVGSVWQFQNGKLVMLPNNTFVFNLYTNIIGLEYNRSLNPREVPTPTTLPINNLVSVTINKAYANVDSNKPFNIQAIALQKGSPASSKLDKSNEEHGMNFVMKYPSFAQCIPHGDVTAGQNVTIDIIGLKPNAKIHGLLGPTPVFNGETNGTGGTSIQFPIPKDTKDGLHPVTIGVDNTALTADCEVNVKMMSVSVQKLAK